VGPHSRHLVIGTSGRRKILRDKDASGGRLLAELKSLVSDHVAQVVCCLVRFVCQSNQGFCWRTSHVLAFHSDQQPLFPQPDEGLSEFDLQSVSFCIWRMQVTIRRCLEANSSCSTGFLSPACFLQPTCHVDFCMECNDCQGYDCDGNDYKDFELNEDKDEDDEENKEEDELL
jgi:hypothetical protein